VDGDALNPTPYTLQFTTEAGPDFNPPSVIQQSIVNGQGNVPVTSSVTLTFNKPIDWRTVNYGIGNSLIMNDNGTGGARPIAATVTPIGSNGILITPTAPNYPLNVAHTYQIYGCGVADLNGNVAGCTYTNFSFTTAFSSPAGGPVALQSSPPNGFTGVPTNSQPQVQFDRPLDPITLSGVTLMQGATPVPGTPVLTSGGTLLTLVPSAILMPSTPYTLNITGVQDLAGNTQASPLAFNFTTGTSFTLAAPQVTSYTPINGATTGENPVLQMLFNEPLNPIQSNSLVFYNVLTGRNVYQPTLTWGANLKSVTVTPQAPLDPNSHYIYYFNTLTDLAGNTNNACCYYFYTGSGLDTTQPEVTSVTPPNSQSGVPLNAPITLQLSKPIDPNTVTNSSVTLSTPGPVAVAGTTVSLSSSGTTLTLSYPSTLAASTTYQINIPTGGVTDLDGNQIVSFTSTFTTGTSTDTTNGTISMTNPAPASLGIPVTQTITMTFSTAIDPNSLTGQYFVVCENQNCNFQIAGTVSMTSNTLTFTPTAPLPSNERIDIYVGYYSNILDMGGNTFNYLYDAYFTTANTASSVRPQVTSISPANGATGVGPYAPIAIYFDESLNPNTINSANFALYNGPSTVNYSVSYSSDRSVVYINTTLPFSSTLTMAISTNVQDYNGNTMAAPCSAPLTATCTYTFTTINQPLTYQPTVIQQRPGNGAGTTIPITLFMNSPMDHASVQDGVTMFVSQNGVLQHGAVSFTADSQGIVWTPNTPFQAGALIELWLYPPAADNSGNVIGNNPYYTYYHTASAPPSNSTPPVETAFSPCHNCTEVPDIEPNVEVQFSKPINCSTVTNGGTIATSSFYILEYANTSTGFAPGTVSCPFPNLIRFTPSVPLVAGPYYYLYLTTAIQDTNGNSFAGDLQNNYFYVPTSAAVDNTPPTVVSVTPLNGDTGIGDNTPIRIVFSKLIDTLTFNSYTVTLQNGANPIPYTVTFATLNNANTQTVATLLPEQPLPDSSTITLTLTNGSATGILDFAGNQLTSQNTSVSFTTKAGEDFSGPSVVLSSIDNDNNHNVPLNTTFTVIFNKPLDPATVSPAGSYFDYYDYNGSGWQTSNVTVSADGRTVTISPCTVSAGVCTNSNLTASHSMVLYACNATDLNGNQESNVGCYTQSFYTGSATVTTAPTVVQTNPEGGNTTTVPTNVMIEATFSEAVRNTSLGAITLTGPGSTPVAVTSYLNDGIYTDDTVVRILPQQLLLPNTAYTVNVSGVQDVAGNTMAAPYSFSFTTGPNFQNIGVVTPTVSVATGAGPTTMTTGGTVTGVPDSPTFTITFDHAVDYEALVHSGITMLNGSSYQVVPGVTLNFVISTDQKTVTVTTNGLAAATTYRLGLEYNAQLYDTAGNGVSGWGSNTYPFTTQ
jgi:hypothetical protein